MTQTLRDTWGDALQVTTLRAASGFVFVNDAGVRSAGSDLRVDFCFTPDQARALAKALKKAAKRAKAGQ